LRHFAVILKYHRPAKTPKLEEKKLGAQMKGKQEKFIWVHGNGRKYFQYTDREAMYEIFEFKMKIVTGKRVWCFIIVNYC